MQIDDEMIGLTLTELALNVLFALVLLNPLNRGPDLKMEMEELKRKNEVCDKALADVGDRLSKMTAELKSCNEERAHLKSTMRPSCGEPQYGRMEYLFTAVVMDSKTYSISGTVYSYSELLQRFKGERNKASRIGCVARVKVAWRIGLDLDEFNAGHQKLQQEFYTTVIGVSRQE